MKPLLEHLPPGEEETFLVKAFDLPYFNTPWHYHPEFEIALITNSKGKLFAGNVITEFKEGDLFFLGANLPHFFKNHPLYYENPSKLQAQSIVIQFLKESLGKDFWSLPQTKKLNVLFELSQRGMQLTSKTKEQLIPQVKNALQTRGMKRLICLMNILDQLADTTDYELISENPIIGHNARDTERLRIIFQYILQHYQQEIRLEDLASLICMTKTSFCRFFQEHTKRNLSSFLVDFRLSHASKLLTESKLSIGQICYECGYNNLSNFNRLFRKKYATTPLRYRKMNFKIS